jgi:hypothetical protein
MEAVRSSWRVETQPMTECKKDIRRSSKRLGTREGREGDVSSKRSGETITTGSQKTQENRRSKQGERDESSAGIAD